MHEYVTVSSSSYDPASLAAKLTEKSSDGWTVVAIVPTGGDITAFLSREGSGSAGSVTAADAQPVADAAPALAAAAMVAAVTPEPAAEPAGWAVAPETAPDPAPVVQAAPQPAVVIAPAVVAPAAVAPAAVAPAVPAGWYADPAGRFELRYWDGGTWTEHVSRAGQQFTDPPVA